jgi:hypothetical protein
MFIIQGSSTLKGVTILITWYGTQAWKWIDSRRQGKFHREFMIRCCSLQGTLSLSM